MQTAPQQLPAARAGRNMNTKYIFTFISRIQNLQIFAPIKQEREEEEVEDAVYLALLAERK